jgi:hypothetical protein
LPDGSYPIPDAKHLHSAAVLAASGHGNVAAAKRLIRKRAKELGVDVNSLPGFGGSDNDNDGDEDFDNVAASYVDDYLDRYPPSRFYEYTGQPVGSAEGATVALSDTTGDDYRWDQTNAVDAYVLCLAADTDAAAGMFGLARSDDYVDQPGPAGTGDANDIAARHQHLFGNRTTAGIERHSPRDGRGHAEADAQTRIARSTIGNPAMADRSTPRCRGTWTWPPGEWATPSARPGNPTATAR